MALALCVECQARPRRTAHGNTKYCAPCQQRLLRAPRSRVTPAQAQQIDALRGTMVRRELAQRVGVSQARLHRYLAEQGLRSNARNYPPEVVTAVCTAFETLGRPRTQTLFPDVNVRSIVERYKGYRPRQIRWTAAQQIEAVRMAGLVSPTAQARYFDRPNAYEGSIRSFWAKTVRCAPRDVNGLGAHTAWQVATPGAVAVLVKHQQHGGARPVVLWLDLARHLRPAVDPIVREAVQVLARFQTWLHGTDNPADIRQMIQERESYARDNPGHDERPPAHSASPFAHAGGDL